MAWTYSGDPTSSQRDELRFILQDTDTELQLLQDEELDYLAARWLPRYDSLTFVASIAAATIGRKFTGVVSVSADGVTVNVADLGARYYEIAQRLREEYLLAQSTGAEIDLSSIMADSSPDYSIEPLIFSVGMHDNPSAGQQDFGGQSPRIVDWSIE